MAYFRRAGGSGTGYNFDYIQKVNRRECSRVSIDLTVEQDPQSQSEPQQCHQQQFSAFVFRLTLDPVGCRPGDRVGWKGSPAGATLGRHNLPGVPRERVRSTGNMGGFRPSLAYPQKRVSKCWLSASPTPARYPTASPLADAANAAESPAGHAEARFYVAGWFFQDGCRSWHPG